MDPNGGSSNMFPMDPLVPHTAHLLSHITSFINCSRQLCLSGSLALDEAFSSFSKLAGGLLIWFARGQNSNPVSYRSRGLSSSNMGSVTRLKPVIRGGPNSIGVFSNYRDNGNVSRSSRFSMKQFCIEAQQFFSLSPLVFAAALVPALQNVRPVVMAVPAEISEIESQSYLDQRPCDIKNQRFSNISPQSLCWTDHAVEPRTGIEFPTVLDTSVIGENANSSFTSEILVGTGSRVMKIIRIKSLKVYAFGFYVHPSDVCEKLGSKYASLPVTESNKSREFYEDLLREDINMTVRLVISVNGIKFNSVKEAFEKSLRARLQKTNPDTDFSCLRSFSSIFQDDIPLHVGTTINFRRTTDGYFITEIGDNKMGAVQSKELCRAFFDMYLGDLPVCEQAKEQIGNNVVSLMKSC